MGIINFRSIWKQITSLLHLRCCCLGTHQTVVVFAPCKRVVSDMVLKCRKALSIKFYNKYWAAKGCQISFRRSSAKVWQRIHLKIICHTLAAQDLLWNLILKTSQQMSPCRLLLYCRENLFCPQ